MADQSRIKRGDRVEEAKEKIDDPANRNLNLAEIGFDVGFNSISSFNAAFKKHPR